MYVDYVYIRTCANYLTLKILELNFLLVTCATPTFRVTVVLVVILDFLECQDEG